MVDSKWPQHKTEICNRERVANIETIGEVERGKTIQGNIASRLDGPLHISSVIERVMNELRKKHETEHNRKS